MTPHTHVGVQTPPEPSPTDDEFVELTVPAHTQQLRLVRLTAAGVASTIGFGLERLEELRIAVDELAAAAIEHAVLGQRIALRYAGGDGTITISGRVATETMTHPELHPVAHELLDLMTDSYSLGVNDGYIEFRLVKHGAPDPSHE